MFEICLFDLDGTLVRTEDIENVRLACRGVDTPAARAAVRASLNRGAERRLYTQGQLQAIRQAHPTMKLGVFTLSPRAYASEVLSWAYPQFNWDTLIGFEDTHPKLHKPHGQGIHLAMSNFGVSDPARVIMFGDSAVDVSAAYHRGAFAVLDSSNWPATRTTEHWRSLTQVPDAKLAAGSAAQEVLAEPARYLPELERLLSGAPAPAGSYRFDKVNHFIPKAIEPYSRPVEISVCGRSFANYASLKQRRSAHLLTASIEANKDAQVFPVEWIQAVRHFIEQRFPASQFLPIVRLVVTAVPHRPGRTPRLESFLMQLHQSLEDEPLFRRSVKVAPGMLAYKDGVKSQHLEFLGAKQRFENVRDHLYVRDQGFLAHGRLVLVIDDVVTTGASLIYAQKYLAKVGASAACLALAKNIGDLKV